VLSYDLKLLLQSSEPFTKYDSSPFHDVSGSLYVLFYQRFRLKCIPTVRT